MSSSKKIDIICIVISVLALILTVLFMFGEKLGIKTLIDEDAEANSDLVYFTKNDLNGNWSTNSATRIRFNGSKISITGTGAYEKDGFVHITSSGYFLASGTLDDGKIIVEADKNDKIWLALGGVSMNCSDDACIRIDNADKVFLTLVAGTENTLISGATYSEATLSSGTDGVIFSHDDLTINGSGILNVQAGYKHGIVSNDALVITGGDIYVSAVSSALRANENMRICAATLRLESDNKGIVVDDEGSYLYVESGKIGIYSEDDAIHCTGEVKLAGGEISIKAGDDGIRSDVSVDISGGTVNIELCYEGIEAPTVNISGGATTIYPVDDGINANGGSNEMGGPSGNGGQGGMAPNGNGSSDGSGDGGQGEMTPNGNGSSDGSGNDGQSGMTPPDGNGSPDGSVDGGQGGEKSDSTNGNTSVTPTVTISGGTLTIINKDGNDADGIDSNGSVYISGGKVRVFLNGDGSNNAVDYGSESGGVFEISGGDVILAGGMAMAEAPTSSLNQSSIFLSISTVEAEATLTVTDSANPDFSLTETLPTSFSNITISNPAFTEGSTVTMIINEDEYVYENIALIVESGNTNSAWAGRPDGDSSEGSDGSSGRPQTPDRK